MIGRYVGREFRIGSRGIGMFALIRQGRARVCLSTDVSTV